MTLPMPARIVREDLRLPASYANFYIANKSVLLPIFADPNDDERRWMSCSAPSRPGASSRSIAAN